MNLEKYVYICHLEVHDKNIMINLVYISLKCFLSEQLLFHFEQYHQYSLSYVTIKNVLQCYTGPLEFSFITNHLSYMSP